MTLSILKIKLHVLHSLILKYYLHNTYISLQYESPHICQCLHNNFTFIPRSLENRQEYVLWRIEKIV